MSKKNSTVVRRKYKETFYELEVTSVERGVSSGKLKSVFSTAWKLIAAGAPLHKLREILKRILELLEDLKWP